MTWRNAIPTMMSVTSQLGNIFDSDTMIYVTMDVTVRFFIVRLMIKELPSMGVLEGPEGNLIFTHDVVALNAGKYKLAGQLVAWSLLHGGHGFAALNPLLFKLMCEKAVNEEEYQISNINDVEVANKIQKVCMAPSYLFE